jgi:hypothetical protein
MESYMDLVWKQAIVSKWHRKKTSFPSLWGGRQEWPKVNPRSLKKILHKFMGGRFCSHAYPARREESPMQNHPLPPFLRLSHLEWDVITVY